MRYLVDKERSIIVNILKRYKVPAKLLYRISIARARLLLYACVCEKHGPLSHNKKKGKIC